GGGVGAGVPAGGAIGVREASEAVGAGERQRFAVHAHEAAIGGNIAASVGREVAGADVDRGVTVVGTVAAEVHHIRGDCERIARCGQRVVAGRTAAKAQAAAADVAGEYVTAGGAAVAVDADVRARHRTAAGHAHLGLVAAGHAVDYPAGAHLAAVGIDETVVHALPGDGDQLRVDVVCVVAAHEGVVAGQFRA